MTDNNTPFFSFLDKTRKAKEYFRVNKFLKDIPQEEQHILGEYVSSGEAFPPPEDIADFLIKFNNEELDILCEASKEWHSGKNEQDLDKAISENRSQINLTLNVSETLDPYRLIVIARDLTNPETLGIQEINVDSGKYIPIPEENIAEAVKYYADSIVKRQEELNRLGG